MKCYTLIGSNLDNVIMLCVSIKYSQSVKVNIEAGCKDHGYQQLHAGEKQLIYFG